MDRKRKERARSWAEQATELVRSNPEEREKLRAHARDIHSRAQAENWSSVELLDWTYPLDTSGVEGGMRFIK